MSLQAINAISINTSKRPHHFWQLKMDSQHGGQWIRRPAALLVRFGVVGSIRSISACQGTTTSISERNFSRLVCFFAVVSSQSEKPSCLPPITPVLACDHRAIVPQRAWVFQGLPIRLSNRR